MPRPEATSKRVAQAAGRVLNPPARMKLLLRQFVMGLQAHGFIAASKAMRGYIADARTCAASALTQHPDKPVRVKSPVLRRPARKAKR